MSKLNEICDIFSSEGHLLNSEYLLILLFHNILLTERVHNAIHLPPQNIIKAYSKHTTEWD